MLTLNDERPGTMMMAIRRTFNQWTMEMSQLMRNEFVDLEPHEYCIGAVFVIAIGFVLLSGRR